MSDMNSNVLKKEIKSLIAKYDKYIKDKNNSGYFPLDVVLHELQDALYKSDKSEPTTMQNTSDAKLSIKRVSNNEADWRDLPIEDRDALNANWRSDNLGKNRKVAVCDCNKPRYIDDENILRCTECNKPHQIL